MPEEPGLDPALLARARRGEAAAFEAVVRAYEKRVWGLCWKLTLDAELARDVTQEAFLRLYEQFGRYDPTRPFEPWFLTLVTNLALNARAKARLHRTASLDAQGKDGEARPEPPDPAATPTAQGAAEDEQRRAIRAAVAALPPMYGGVVALHYLEGLGVKEIGERLGMPVGTVKIRLHRARSALREKLSRFDRRAP